MTSIERAQHFLNTKARGIALTVIPLAAAAAGVAPAAASGFTFATAMCSPSTSGGGVLVTDPNIAPTPACATAQLPAGPDGTTGVKLFGTATMMASFDTYLTINISAQNIASGSGGIIPVSYDFTLSNTSDSEMDWDVYFRIDGTLDSASGSASGISTGGTIMNSFNVDATNIGAAQDYVLHVEATDVAANQGDLFTLSVPPNSIDVNPVASAPEPASFSLLTLILAPLAFRKRKG